jgi:hypothetical protein
VPSLSRSLPSGADLSAPVFLPRALSLSVSWAWIASHRAVAPRTPFLLSAPWACPVSSAPSVLAVDRRVRTPARRRISRPQHPPTRPAPFLEPRQCPAHTPRLISLSFTLSRDLARSSSPALVPKVPLPLLKLAQDLACLKSPPRGRNGSPELLRPA